MSPKERRARLFKQGRPNIRSLEERDLGWLWAAYKAGSFQFKPGLSQEEFTQQVLLALQGAVHFLIEDRNNKFKDGSGPVALIGVTGTEERIEPAIAVFKWATARNVLRLFVAFFQWVKSENIGECIVRASAKDRLMKKMIAYGVLYPREMLTVYGVRGKKK